jgi:O-antigen/teichoic acid export membrane protein
MSALRLFGPFVPRVRLGGMVNVRGDLFSTAASFGGLLLIKLVSSMVLTRLLYPEAYGVVTLVATIAFMFEMVSDVGTAGLMVRHERGDERTFIDTVWTLRLVRGVANAALLYLLAPLLARLYGSPELTEALRIFSVFFVVHGLESMAFLLAVRRRRARLMNYCELAASAASTAFVIAWSYFQRDWHGMVYGMVFNRACMAVASWFFYREDRPRPRFEQEALAASMGFARYTLPSSMVTLISAQFDKVVFLRLFDMQMLGLYGLAAGIVGPVDSLVVRIARSVLFPRCADNFRRDPGSVRERYYRDNIKLLMLLLALPAALTGAASFVVQLLYDPRYAYAGVIVHAFALRAMVSAFAHPAENLLMATGTPRPALVGNLLRLAWLVAGSLTGYWLAGFGGFLWMAALTGVPALAYFLWLQHRRGLLILRYEAIKLAYAATVFLLSWGVSAELARMLLHTGGA